MAPKLNAEMQSWLSMVLVCKKIGAGLCKSLCGAQRAESYKETGEGLKSGTDTYVGKASDPFQGCSSGINRFVFSYDLGGESPICG